MGTKPPHKHDTCSNPVGGAVCDGGILWDFCDYPGCDNEYCSPAGHCGCKCHSGRLCICKRYKWPEMKRSRSDKMKEPETVVFKVIP